METLLYFAEGVVWIIHQNLNSSARRYVLWENTIRQSVRDYSHCFILKRYDDSSYSQIRVSAIWMMLHEGHEECTDTYSMQVEIQMKRSFNGSNPSAPQSSRKRKARWNLLGFHHNLDANSYHSKSPAASFKSANPFHLDFQFGNVNRSTRPRLRLRMVIHGFGVATRVECLVGCKKMFFDSDMCYPNERLTITKPR
jgi:hypothetical protein